jgi:putative RecB family exonuclease
VPHGFPLPRRLSPTAIDIYRTCPQQFFLAYIAHERREQPTGPNLVLANAVHHALERFYGLPPADRSPEALGQWLRAVWPEHRARHPFHSQAEEREWGLKALAMLERYASRHDLLVEPLAREVWVRRRLPDGLELFGKVDRVDDDGDGGLHLIDYKTGRREIDADDLPGDSAAMLYTVAAQATYGRPVRRVSFLYLESGRQVDWELEDHEEFQAAAERLGRHVRALRSDTEWLAMPGEICRFCDFAHICPERGAVSMEELVVDREQVPF